MSQDQGKTVAVPQQKGKSLDTGFLKGKDKGEPTVGMVAENLPMQAAGSVTVLYSGNTTPPPEQDNPVKRFMDNPVVGWLVVIHGPGQGISLPLGNGQNSLGRGHDQRVVLDFGDANISREQHATVTYDPLGRAFYLQNGRGVNLCYLETADGSLMPVLAPVRLEQGQHIRLGNTTLKFMALCGEGFDWGNADG